MRANCFLTFGTQGGMGSFLFFDFLFWLFCPHENSYVQWSERLSVASKRCAHSLQFRICLWFFSIRSGTANRIKNLIQSRFPMLRGFNLEKQKRNNSAVFESWEDFLLSVCREHLHLVLLSPSFEPLEVWKLLGWVPKISTFYFFIQTFALRFLPNFDTFSIYLFSTHHKFLIYI